jgi:RNA polymerase sigma-70 factor (ECF subfamily)
MQREELERIYDEHAACAAALFRRFVHCEADVRDLLQDWLVKIAKGVDSVAEIANERSYLLRIAYRVAVDGKRSSGAWQRQKDRASEESPREFLPEIDPDREMMRCSLETSLATLPVEQRLVVQLKLWDGLTFSEIGEVLDISSNTASSRYRYGLSKLRETLRPLYNELCN